MYKPFGAMAVYYGVSDTNTIWPVVCGGQNNAHAFMSGRATAYGDVAFPTPSTLKARGVGIYSSVTPATTFLGRKGLVPGVLAPALWSPQRGIFPSPGNTTSNPWRGQVT
jgi:hypothetical protein